MRVDSLKVRESAIIVKLIHQTAKMTTNLVRRTTKILVLNPNSSQTMTHGLEQGIREMELSQVCMPPTYLHRDLRKGGQGG